MSDDQTTPQATLPLSASRYPLQIISLTGVCWEGLVREASFPGVAGRLGVMAGHLPLLSPLAEGFVHVFPADGSAPLQFHVSAGYLEVQPGQVIVLADLATRSPQRDAARAEEARQRAQSPMAAAFNDPDYPMLHAALMSRLARIGRSLRRG